MNKHRPLLIFILPVIIIASLSLTSCMEGGQVISRPDEYTRIYEASEDIILKALKQVFREKGFGNASINPEKKQVESDYLFQNEWRSKATARVKKINWKECEVTLSVNTEKKTSTGWEMRRLLESEQYDKLFTAIELQIYQEQYKLKEDRSNP
ncbi:MAG TPA: hypothetical protein VMT12_08800 [Syntrophales bacterium]|nr:hypothetical protein [Syntrophales bacterium]